MVDAQVPATSNAVQDAAAADRRRPGRLHRVSPTLIPLLRHSDPADASTAQPDLALVFDENELAPARGLLVGAALSVPLWAALIFAGRWMLS